MKKLLLFICAVYTSLATFGQDYYPVKRNDIAYFSGNPFKINSVKTKGQDSVYYLLKQIERISNGGSCALTALGTS